LKRCSFRRPRFGIIVGAMPTHPVQRAEFAIKSGLLTCRWAPPSYDVFEPHTRAREAEAGLRIHVRHDGLTGTHVCRVSTHCCRH
jgi:hypothetical protein